MESRKDYYINIEDYFGKLPVEKNGEKEKKKLKLKKKLSFIYPDKNRKRKSFIYNR